MGEVTIFATTLFGAGVLFLALGIPLFLKRVRPNFLYGCRTTKTMSDERIWYAVNRITGKSMIVGGAVMIAASTVLFALRRSMNPDYAAIALISLLILASVFMVVNSIREQRHY